MTLLERRRALMGMGGGGVLPSDYVALDYVNINNGNRYIKTDYVPSTTSKIEVKFKATATTSAQAGVIFGSRNGYNNKSFYFKTGVSSGGAVNMTAELGWSSVMSVTTPNVMLNENVFGVDNGTFYINDTVLGTYTNTFTPEYPIYIMMINSDGSPFSTSPIGHLISAKIWENSVLVRDYIPAKRLLDNVVGLFDVVTQTFNQML